MNVFKKIKRWFYNTKPGLRLEIRELVGSVHSLEEAVESLEQKLWKTEKFKEDYRNRLTKYYDECIRLKKEIKKYNNLIRRCKKFKEFYGISCGVYISTMKRGQCTKKKKLNG